MDQSESDGQRVFHPPIAFERLGWILRESLGDIDGSRDENGDRDEGLDQIEINHHPGPDFYVVRIP